MVGDKNKVFIVGLWVRFKVRVNWRVEFSVTGLGYWWVEGYC